MGLSKRERKIKKMMSNRQEGVIVLEDIHDPHNAAAVLRSMDAFGFQKVYFIFDQEKKFNPRQVGKISSGSANKWLDFRLFESTDGCIESLKNEGFEVIATIIDGKAESIFESRLNKVKPAIMFGNEHRGLSATAIGQADRKIYIPMRGMVQSLNLSVAAAVVMYEITRQKLLNG